ncbi:MAG: hypothetical protein A3J63_02545 [Candidatus Moranbacteria bacterium RIFCSPHIGHO2_02_FULL_40_12b]|nr:MAG: hypothetical protein A3J63_02545 [Candidatus Moranbacteria bacterium RIFCSPHIGHO2_02_FULL_40_12b]
MVSFEKSVGAVLFRRVNSKNKYLLLHYKSGHWDFPKGHQEKGENDEVTLRREVKEETGIQDIKIIPGFSKKIGYFYVAKGKERKKRLKVQRGIKIKKQVIYYLAETREKEVKISFEHVGFRWLDYSQALKKITFKNSKNVLILANNYFAKIPGS